jgi:hypothetical protein
MKEDRLSLLSSVALCWGFMVGGGPCFEPGSSVVTSFGLSTVTRVLLGILSFVLTG